MNDYILNYMKNINATYQSIIAFFYQKIDQNQYSNSKLATYAIDYSLLLPSSEFIVHLNPSQVGAQTQTFINLCNILIKYITTNVNFQTKLPYERIQNVLANSISQLDGFANTLLSAAYQNLFNYTVPYNMGFLNILYLNNIDINTFPKQASLNYEINDYNNIKQNDIILLSRA